MSAEPKDPPKNVVVSVIPEEVNRVKVTFKPPEEPNGNITAYYVYVYEKEKLVKNVTLNIIKRDHNMMTAVIEGLKGGHSYSIQVRTFTHVKDSQSFWCLPLSSVFLSSLCLQISAKNGAGRSPPSPHVQITTGIKGMLPLPPPPLLLVFSPFRSAQSSPFLSAAVRL